MLLPTVLPHTRVLNEINKFLNEVNTSLLPRRYEVDSQYDNYDPSQGKENVLALQREQRRTDVLDAHEAQQRLVEAEEEDSGVEQQDEEGGEEGSEEGEEEGEDGQKKRFTEKRVRPKKGKKAAEKPAANNEGKETPETAASEKEGE